MTGQGAHVALPMKVLAYDLISESVTKIFQMANKERSMRHRDQI
jgi:hypothetical protein